MIQIIYKLLVLAVFCFSVHNIVSAQVKEVEVLWETQLDTSKVDITKSMYLDVDQNKIPGIVDEQPNFGLYKDNYFISGISTNKKVNQYTADAKFQISIRQKLAKGVLPLNSILMLTYTQKSFWDIYQKSSPFADNNYNPGLAVVTPIISNNKLGGVGIMAFEHESNGRGDSLESRSWNYFVFTGTYFYNPCFTLYAKFWAGWIGSDNPDLLNYRGYGMIAINYRSINDRIWLTSIINPRKKFEGVNLQLELSFKVNQKANQYLFVQWYNGAGESLLEYNQYTSMVRMGICIKPPMRNLF
ncbi:phospholipase A [Mangrovibacterium lignilyticum]|uniref:phospholipase A n=1 Tax=Mangrovibacterium lignilyticum TaxID=2668052 RepID=UPI0013D329CE|nr:phospholipase A [Mangrovibacterium lignilyticum]